MVNCNEFAILFMLLILGSPTKQAIWFFKHQKHSTSMKKSNDRSWTPLKFIQNKLRFLKL